MIRSVDLVVVLGALGGVLNIPQPGDVQLRQPLPAKFVSLGVLRPMLAASQRRAVESTSVSESSFYHSLLSSKSESLSVHQRCPPQLDVYQSRRAAPSPHDSPEPCVQRLANINEEVPLRPSSQTSDLLPRHVSRQQTPKQVSITVERGPPYKHVTCWFSGCQQKWSSNQPMDMFRPTGGNLVSHPKTMCNRAGWINSHPPRNGPQQQQTTLSTGGHNGARPNRDFFCFDWL